MTIQLIVPCYNEEKRLDVAAFLALADGDITLLFVDDGSRDGTANVLAELERRGNGHISFLRLEKNSGKAEAVRRGIACALEGSPSFVGFVDADLATPPHEIRRLAEEAKKSDASVIMGSRVARAGALIDRKPLRHYLGRGFATAASLLLSAQFYDTQCGAKIFRVSDALRVAVQEPFLSRWIFDVELLGRLLIGGPGAAPLPERAFREVPLHEWRDVAGSKLRPSHAFGVASDLARIRADLRARRARLT